MVGDAIARIILSLQAQLQRVRRLAVRHLGLVLFLVPIGMREVSLYPPFLVEFGANERVPQCKLIECPLDECRVRQPDAQVVTLDLAAPKHLLDRKYGEPPCAGVAGRSVRSGDSQV